MFFSRRKSNQGPVQPVIQVFVRYCNFSQASAHKKRAINFSHEQCYHNLLETLDSRVSLTSFLDTAYDGTHFMKGKALEMKAGTEANAFLYMLDYVKNQNFHPDTIIYFLEDDYFHKPNWIDVLFEGFSLDVDYVTLYDHRDKYMHYPDLKSQIFLTPSCHWRTTPSTTNTYAMRYRTLMEHFPIHQKFSRGVKITKDHDKFCNLAKKGAILVSSIPGYSTHAEPEFASPFF